MKGAQLSKLEPVENKKIEFDVVYQEDYSLPPVIYGIKNISDKEAERLFLKLQDDQGYVIDEGDENDPTIYNIEKLIEGNTIHVRLTDFTRACQVLAGYLHDKLAVEAYTREAFYAKSHKYLKDLNTNSDDNGFAIIMCDGNCFKYYNEIYGHFTGDRVIKLISSTLKASIYDSRDLLGRFGGDEFAILLENVTPENAQTALERLCKNATECYLYFPEDPSKREAVTMSFGCIYVSDSLGHLENDHDIDEVFSKALKLADDELKEIKAESKSMTPLDKFETSGGEIENRDLHVLIQKKAASDAIGSKYSLKFISCQELLKSEKEKK